MTPRWIPYLMLPLSGRNITDGRLRYLHRVGKGHRSKTSREPPPRNADEEKAADEKLSGLAEAGSMYRGGRRPVTRNATGRQQSARARRWPQRPGHPALAGDHGDAMVLIQLCCGRTPADCQVAMAVLAERAPGAASSRRCR